MATTITVQDSTADTALEATYENVAAAMEFLNTGKEVIHVKNGSTEMTLAVDSQSNCSQAFDHDTSEIVTASEERFVGPFSPSRFNDSDGLVQLTFSDTTDGTVAVIKLA